jgi:hypothetical protein
MSVHCPKCDEENLRVSQYSKEWCSDVDRFLRYKYGRLVSYVLTAAPIAKANQGRIWHRQKWISKRSAARQLALLVEISGSR